MKNRTKKRASRTVEGLKASGAGMARATAGRSRRFTDRKKAASRRACRGKVEA